MAGSAGEIDPTTAGQVVGEVHCGSCGGLVAVGEQFCTSCGKPITAAIALHPEPSPFAIAKRVRPVVVGLAFAAIALVSVAALEFVQQRNAYSRLSRARSELSQTHAALETTRAQLTKTKNLSLRQAAILVKTAAVLKKVDPLLSDADRLQGLTGNIQTARDAFAADSNQMTSDLLLLENYEANPENYPNVDQYYLVGQVNRELQSVDSDYANLSSYDTSFSAATTKFGNHADGFTASVRQLQRELQRLGAKK